MGTLDARIVARDAKTGALLWNAELAIDNNMVWCVVVNPSPDRYGAIRPGDNLYTDSLVAVDLKTGAYNCHFQYIPHGVWDLRSARRISPMSKAPGLRDQSAAANDLPRRIDALSSYCKAHR